MPKFGGYDYALVVTCGLTRFTRVFPCNKHITGEETIKITPAKMATDLKIWWHTLAHFCCQICRSNFYCLRQGTSKRGEG